MSRFQNRLYAVTKSRQPANANTAPENPNPFSSLGRAELRGLGGRLGGNTVFAMKLRDRVIDPDTMTEGFRRHVAETMRAPLDVVIAHFAGRSELAAHAHYKAEQKPEIGRKQSLDHFVMSRVDTIIVGAVAGFLTFATMLGIAVILAALLVMIP